MAIAAPTPCARDSCPHGGAAPDTARSDVRAVMRELADVAAYVARVRREIASLKVVELSRDRIPEAHDELGHVVNATASATHTIMAAAEGILRAPKDSIEAYRDQVNAKVVEIFEACSFQDITGQRITKVVEALSQLEQRLSRFAGAVDARDAIETARPEEEARQARRQALFLNGPQARGAAIDQGEIDKLFG